MIQTTKGLLAEFKTFAIKGNAFELAIAVIVGNAFSAIVTSLVGDVISPLLGLVTGNVDFKTLSFALKPDLVIRYGALLQAIFNFLVVALSIFLVFKLFSAARKRFSKEEAVTPAEKQVSRQEHLLEEIRDLLKERK